MLLSKQHYSHKIEADVVAICKPLEQYGINYFNYARLYYSGSAYSLVTNWESLSNHCSKEYSLSPPIPKELYGKSFHYLPYDHNANFIKTPVLLDYSYKYNLWFPIYFVESHKEYVDIFMYATVADNAKIINFYLNNIEILEKFKYYFKDKARQLIRKSNNNRIIVPEHMYSSFKPLKNTNSYEFKNNHFETKRFILPSGNKEVSITKREIEVIKFMAMGCSIKEIAKSMLISPRTIEDYLNNIKHKLGVQKKSEIIRYISKFNLL